MHGDGIAACVHSGDGGRLWPFFGTGGLYDAVQEGAHESDGATIGNIYYIALAEWHLTPAYINENWTEEMLLLMFQKRREYLRPLAQQQEQVTRVSDQELFQQMGVEVGRA